MICQKLSRSGFRGSSSRVRPILWNSKPPRQSYGGCFLVWQKFHDRSRQLGTASIHQYCALAETVAWAGVSPVVRPSGVYQSHARRAIRIWPKIEMDELVFYLPEKKWMSIYVHWV